MKIAQIVQFLYENFLVMILFQFKVTTFLAEKQTTFLVKIFFL